MWLIHKVAKVLLFFSAFSGIKPRTNKEFFRYCKLVVTILLLLLIRVHIPKADNLLIKTDIGKLNIDHLIIKILTTKLK